jgi:dynein intermediate chain 2
MSLVVFVALAVFAQVAYLYTKARSEFGKHCNFKDEPAKLLATVPVTDAYADQYTKRNPSIAEVDTTPHM